MVDLLVRHPIEDPRGSGITLAQCFGEAAIDSVVFLLAGNGEREDFLLTELGEALHIGLVNSGFS
jgi:hypothetical protein